MAFMDDALTQLHLFWYCNPVAKVPEAIDIGKPRERVVEVLILFISTTDPVDEIICRCCSNAAKVRTSGQWVCNVVLAFLVVDVHSTVVRLQPLAPLGLPPREVLLGLEPGVVEMVRIHFESCSFQVTAPLR